MTKIFKKILIIDDNEDILFSLRMLLKKHADVVEMEQDPRRIPFLVNQSDYDVILLDMNFSQDTSSGKEGFYWLEEIKKRKPQAKVVMITAYGDVETAVRSLKSGASDFILKPWKNEKLLETLQEVVSESASIKAGSPSTPSVHHNSHSIVNKNDTSDEPLSHIIGKSEAIQSVFTLIKKVAATDANVLILGENGTGKEVFAQAIHDLSNRKEKVFVSVDMGSITENLFESELFGHKKGAFTDAKDDRAGRFEAANKGTLFLDEIGNLPLSLQSKLLTALQRREIIRVGENKPIAVDIRLISATNMPLHEMVAEGDFRQDLMYRINTIELHLPPLRERIGDIPLLATHFVKIYCEKYNLPIKNLSEAALRKLSQHSFPGNVRELQHAIERAVIMSEEEVLDAGDFLFLIQKNEAQELEIQDYNLENIEKIVIQKAIAKYSGNISRAAKALGLTRAALYRRLEKYEI